MVGRRRPRIVPSVPLPPDATWESVIIRFLSDHQIEIRTGNQTKVLNYAEFGLENQKSGKPLNAWVNLVEFARHDGVLERRKVAISADKISKMEKAVQALRKHLMDVFELSDDPFYPCRGTSTYKTKFKLSFPQSDIR